MKLTKFEQSGFILETDNGFRLAFDIGNKTPLEKLNGVTVDGMLISHIHADHFSIEHIEKIAPKQLLLNAECLGAMINNGKVLNFPAYGQIEAGDVITVGDEIKVTYFSVDHGPNTSGPVENLGFLIEVNNKTIYFAGDMFYPSGIDVTNLEVDTLLIPVGTFYTFGPEEAIAFAKSFKKVGKIIPMHYEKEPQTRKQFIELAWKEGLQTESAPLT
jgi:L-ascorbate metabolism protein UlaG (beta-lactamase superfamily)